MDRAEIKHVAELAELSLTDDEEAKLAEDIGRFLAYAKELDAVDVSSVPPTAHVGDVVPKRSGEGWRPDEVKPGISHEDALAGAPRAEHDGFAVPTFVE